MHACVMVAWKYVWNDKDRSSITLLVLVRQMASWNQQLANLIDSCGGISP
jgi:hypothetical protein